MSDVFDDFNKIFKKDLMPIFVKYIKDPNNNISDKINDFVNDPRIFIADIYEKFSKNKDNDVNQRNYKDIEDIPYMDESFDEEYDDLLKRLILIEENMIKIEKILKEKN
mgnify:CR=1 FL=1